MKHYYYSQSHSMQQQQQLCDLSIHVNGQQTFFLNEKTVSAYSGRLRKMMKQERIRKCDDEIKNWSIEMNDFPGGPDGFEMVLRFCYNNGTIEINVSNVCLLHCCAIYLGMTSDSNLLKQTQTFLQGVFKWTWNDIVSALQSCDGSVFTCADSSGLIEKLIIALLPKIGLHQTVTDSTGTSSSSTSSSPETASRFWLSSPDLSSTKRWWFDDMALLPPLMIEKFVKNMGDNNNNNNSLTLTRTRFIIHYLKCRGACKSGNECGGLADTAVDGVMILAAGRTSSFSCRGLLSILKTVSGFGVSKDCRGELEGLIGSMLDKATLDDLLISGQDKGVYYDVKLVLRLIQTFVNYNYGGELVCIQRMKKVGRLIDKYLGEISPDHNLKMSKFLGIAQSLPDYARDCYDGVYKAIDMYLESHPALSFEERARLCKCLNYEKLSLEACKDLAKNPRIPPEVAIEALKSQKCPIGRIDNESNYLSDSITNQENEYMKLNIEKMQRRVVKLEKACKEMKGQMSLLVTDNIIPSRSRLC